MAEGRDLETSVDARDPIKVHQLPQHLIGHPRQLLRVAGGDARAPRLRTRDLLAVGAGLRDPFSAAEASAVADRWDSRAYGRLNGVLAAPVSAVTALSAGVAVAISSVSGSYQAMAYTMAAVCLNGGMLAVRQ